MSDLEAGGPERRARITADIMAKTGIDEPMIERLVRLFYQRIQAEPVLGPIFAARISDWEHHIAKLCTFWSSVALMSGRYHGQPMRMHVDLPVTDRILIAGLRFSRARPLRSAHLSLPNISLNALGVSLTVWSWGSPRHKVGSQRRAIRDHKRKARRCLMASRARDEADSAGQQIIRRGACARHPGPAAEGLFKADRLAGETRS